jgi:hypothetical protein
MDQAGVFFFCCFSKLYRTQKVSAKKYKYIPITGCGGPKGCETSRLPHFLHNQFKDGGEVVSLTRRLLFGPKKIPGTHFC